MAEESEPGDEVLPLGGSQLSEGELLGGELSMATLDASLTTSSPHYRKQ